jgi:hypothetical protein
MLTDAKIWMGVAIWVRLKDATAGIMNLQTVLCLNLSACKSWQQNKCMLYVYMLVLT